MEYKRYIQNSNEYKELVNNLNNKINNNIEETNRLTKRKDELVKFMNDNYKKIESLDLRMTIAKNKIEQNIKKEQKAKNTIKVLIPGVLLTTALFATATASPPVVDAPQLFSIASAGTFIATLTASAIKYHNPNSEIKAKTIINAMEQDKNIKLSNDIKRTAKQKQRKLDQYKKSFQEYESITNELYFKKQEKVNLINQKNTIMSVMKNYDNVNYYQRMVNASTNRNKYTKVLKRSTI